VVVASLHLAGEAVAVVRVEVDVEVYQIEFRVEVLDDSDFLLGVSVVVHSALSGRVHLDDDAAVRLFQWV
jgi:hypothetical protein